MSKSIEELMKPRFKVIAEWPTGKLKKGHIIHPEKDMLGDGLSTALYISDLELYPHLFKPLAWWEEREESEMPEYVKRGPNVFKLKHIKKPNPGKSVTMFLVEGVYNEISSNDTFPATLEEYTSYINKSK